MPKFILRAFGSTLVSYTKDIALRVRITLASRQDYTIRLRLASNAQFRDIRTRAIISSPPLAHDLSMRLVLSPYHNANILLFPVLRPMA